MLHNGLKDAPNFAPFPGGHMPQTNTGFLGHTRVNIPNDTSISSAMFVGLMVVTNTETQRHTGHYNDNNKPDLMLQ